MTWWEVSLHVRKPHHSARTDVTDRVEAETSGEAIRLVAGGSSDYHVEYCRPVDRGFGDPAWLVGVDGKVIERRIVRAGLPVWRRPVRVGNPAAWLVEGSEHSDGKSGVIEEAYDAITGRVGRDGPRIFVPRGSGLKLWRQRCSMTLEVLSDRAAFPVVFDSLIDDARPPGSSGGGVLCVKALEVAGDWATFEVWGVAVPGRE